MALRLPWKPRAAAAEGDLAYAHRPRLLRPGHRVELLRAGADAYPSMLAAIAAARDSVCFETYVLRDDATGRRFHAALAERARAGVAVRVLYDALGSLGLSEEFVDGLRAAGAEVVEYGPVAPWRRRFRLTRRDHRKILVVDGRVGFAGGLNVGDEYAPAEAGGGGWYDLHARVEGPAVAELAGLFRRTWVRAGGRRFPLPVPAPDPPAAPWTPTEGARATALANDELRDRWRIRDAYLHAIARAARSVRIMNAYFLPDRAVRRALGRAVRRGADVRVVVPAESDVALVQAATRHLYPRLLRAGVRIFEWPERMMHAKAAVVDAVWSTIGSYNLDYRSLRLNLEVALAVVDRAFGERLSALIEADCARCHEVGADALARRPWWRRFGDWLAYALRRWL